MKHREAEDGLKLAVSVGHRRDIALGDLDLRPQLAPQPFAIARLQLQHLERSQPRRQATRRGPQAGAHLQHPPAQVKSIQAPGYELALDPALPAPRGANQVVDSVHGPCTVATARAAAPSWRPTKPMPSPRVALTFTRATSTPIASASFRRIASRWGARAGRSMTTVASTWTTSCPRSLSRLTVARRSSIESASR